MKALVIFYSFEGNTKYISQVIAKELSCDVLELKPVKEIQTKGFMKYIWGGKQVLMKELPALCEYSQNFDAYDLLIIGTPVWSFTFAPPLRTFFSKKHFRDKKIALFCCNEGGAKNTLKNMQRQLEKNEVISMQSFVNVLKNKEKNEEKAKDWARSFNKFI